MRWSLSKPLQRCVRLVPDGEMEGVIVVLVYEKLPNFCYGCEKIGHILRFCDDQTVDRVKLKYGPWLNAAKMVEQRRRQSPPSTTSQAAETKPQESEDRVSSSRLLRVHEDGNDGRLGEKEIIDGRGGNGERGKAGQEQREGSCETEGVTRFSGSAKGEEVGADLEVLGKKGNRGVFGERGGRGGRRGRGAKGDSWRDRARAVRRENEGDDGMGKRAGVKRGNVEVFDSGGDLTNKKQRCLADEEDGVSDSHFVLSAEAAQQSRRT